MQAFDFIVVGAGLMGAAAARHLAKSDASVLLLGPGEPADKRRHQGVFASHYDEARITRHLDPRPGWATVSARAIHRYAEIEREGGESFFHEVGSLMVGPSDGDGSAYFKGAEAVGLERGLEFSVLDNQALAANFPIFSFPDDVYALWEPRGAGYINPRGHVAAESKAAVAAGAVRVDAEVSQLEEAPEGVTVTCVNGERFQASKVVVAAGAFSRELLPQPIQMDVFARTVAFLELDDVEAERLKAMPSLIYQPPDMSFNPYILPPVRYPDGKIYIKIGGDPDDQLLQSNAEISEWFRSDGNLEVRDFQVEQLLRFMPDLRYRSVSSASCVTSFTKTLRPLIYHQTDRIVALTGGNGVGAKCGDELGRLGAAEALGEPAETSLFNGDFGPDGAPEPSLRSPRLEARAD
ncbi:MAG: FAD-dependent oxidoreductase [Alphaproteobacteria bacterium]|nr:FAD-dependent oxidoreductase [Alphaproteobacteria bacterium SS10]